MLSIMWIYDSVVVRMKWVIDRPILPADKRVHFGAAGGASGINSKGFVGESLWFERAGFWLLRLLAFAAIDLAILTGPFVLAVEHFQESCQLAPMNIILSGVANTLQPPIPDPAENRVRGDAEQFRDFIDGVGIIPPDQSQRVSALSGHRSDLL